MQLKLLILLILNFSHAIPKIKIHVTAEIVTNETTTIIPGLNDGKFFKSEIDPMGKMLLIYCFGRIFFSHLSKEGEEFNESEQLTALYPESSDVVSGSNPSQASKSLGTQDSRSGTKGSKEFTKKPSPRKLGPSKSDQNPLNKPQSGQDGCPFLNEGGAKSGGSKAHQDGCHGGAKSGVSETTIKKAPRTPLKLSTSASKSSAEKKPETSEKCTSVERCASATTPSVKPETPDAYGQSGVSDSTSEESRPVERCASATTPSVKPKKPATYGQSGVSDSTSEKCTSVERCASATTPSAEPKLYGQSDVSDLTSKMDTPSAARKSLESDIEELSWEDIYQSAANHFFTDDRLETDKFTVENPLQTGHSKKSSSNVIALSSVDFIPPKPYTTSTSRAGELPGQNSFRSVNSEDVISSESTALDENEQKLLLEDIYPQPYTTSTSRAGKVSIQNPLRSPPTAANKATDSSTVDCIPDASSPIDENQKYQEEWSETDTTDFIPPPSETISTSEKEQVSRSGEVSGENPLKTPNPELYFIPAKSKPVNEKQDFIPSPSDTASTSEKEQVSRSGEVSGENLLKIYGKPKEAIKQTIELLSVAYWPQFQTRPDFSQQKQQKQRMAKR